MAKTLLIVDGDDYQKLPVSGPKEAAQRVTPSSLVSL